MYKLEFNNNEFECNKVFKTEQEAYDYACDKYTYHQWVVVEVKS